VAHIFFVILPFIAVFDKPADLSVPFPQGPIITQKMPVICTGFAVHADSLPAELQPETFLWVEGRLARLAMTRIIPLQVVLP